MKNNNVSNVEVNDVSDININDVSDTERTRTQRRFHGKCDL